MMSELNDAIAGLRRDWRLRDVTKGLAMFLLGVIIGLVAVAVVGQPTLGLVAASFLGALLLVVLLVVLMVRLVGLD